MNINDLIKILENNGLKKGSTATEKYTYAKSGTKGIESFINGANNRSKSQWQRAQFILADNTTNISKEEYLPIWTKYWQKYQNQYLCILNPNGEAVFYDWDGNEIDKDSFLRIVLSLSIIINQPLQKIVYGAPGTGKSFSTDFIIKNKYENQEDEKEHVFRTTFHPDSDYSTFVGCYKPTKSNTKREQVILDYDSLVDKFKEFIDVKKNMTIACTTFGYEYHDSIVRMQPKHSVGELVADAYKNNTTYDSVVRGGMAVYEECTDASNISADITYDFVPQSFTKAYIKAWEEKLLAECGKKDEEQKARLTPTEGSETKKLEIKPVYLVIEEINRGNCAQIFGDLFQLLDRNDDRDDNRKGYGMSCYPIKPDTDLGNYIAEELRKFAQKHNIDIDTCSYKEIINGEEMLLPNNLYIWATMNTSDQSLFPIDSAFKRRWDWEYVPISEGFDLKSGDPIKNTIKIGDYECDWWKFVQAINKKIGETTKSEDKKLGFYFCKADNKIIDAKKFVGKVIFYLWNDVFKDYETDLFDNLVEEQENPTFEMFYNSENGETKINEDVVKKFIKNVCPDLFSKDKPDNNPDGEQA